MLKDLFETLIFGAGCRERFLPLEGAAAEPLRGAGVQLAGVSRLTTGYRVERTAPRYHVVLATTDGSAVLDSGSGRRNIDSPSITVLAAGSRYAYSVAAGEWQVAWFHLAARSRWRHFSGVIAWGGSDAATLHALASVYAEERAMDRPAVAHAVARSLTAALGELQAGGGLADREVEERVRAVARAIEADPARRWTEAELASLAHYSPQHFRRLAKAQWGVPPLRMVARARMDRACALLEHTGLRVAAVAGAVGYSDEFAFSAAFRRHTGLSPRNWRAARARPGG
ncbi:MAG: AraC family transcriptional regulator [Candidatus Sumerlaeia bacterium]|nr:AraC family transcriptional regulator [Candidatus Sumerlaeia bacterium]